MRIDLTLDCENATVLAEFWKAALGYVDEPPPAPFRTRQEWLASLDLPESTTGLRPSRNDDDDDPDAGAWICDPDGLRPRISFLRVPEKKVGKNRLHMDVRVGGRGDDRWRRIVAEAERLVLLGGSVQRTVDQHHIVMADPEGNEFCIAS